MSPDLSFCPRSPLLKTPSPPGVDASGPPVWWTATRAHTGPRSAPIPDSRPKPRLVRTHDTLRVCKLLCDVVVYDLFVGEVGLVSDEEAVDPFDGVAFDLSEPGLYVREGVLVGHVVHDDDPVRPAVVGRGDGPETLLPCGVPDLELDRLALQLERADLDWEKKGGGKRRIRERERGGWSVRGQE